jgi:nucleoside-diphosphate-sugar epimerase
MPRILITGANSFIGKNFLRFSAYKNVDVISLLDLGPENIDFKKYDVVLHLAAIVHQSKKYSNSEYFNVNRELTLNVAENAKRSGVRQFIFLSTVKVYGNCIPGNEIWNEDSACCPDDAYGMSKHQAEEGLKKIEDSSFIVSIIRTPIVYGPDVGANIMKLIKLIEAFPVLPFRKVENNRHYTYVENLVGFIDRIIKIRASGTFIAMDETGMTTTGLVRLLSKHLNRKIILFRLPGWIIRAGTLLKPEIFDRLYKSFYLDNTKTKIRLNYSPLFSCEEGIGRTIQYYIKGKNP